MRCTYVTLVLVLPPSYALRVICWFIISVHIKLITLLTTEIVCAVNVPERSYLLLFHTLRKLTLGITNFMLNPPSNILVIRLASVVVVLTQSLHVLFHCGKHFDSKNCYLSSPTVQSEQNLEGMSTTCV